MYPLLLLLFVAAWRDAHGALASARRSHRRRLPHRAARQPALRLCAGRQPHLPRHDRPPSAGRRPHRAASLRPPSSPPGPATPSSPAPSSATTPRPINVRHHSRTSPLDQLEKALQTPATTTPPSSSPRNTNPPPAAPTSPRLSTMRTPDTSTSTATFPLPRRPSSPRRSHLAAGTQRRVGGCAPLPPLFQCAA